MSSNPVPIAVYLHHEGQQLGPYSLETAREIVASGSVPSDVLAWSEGMTHWVPLAELLPPMEVRSAAVAATEPGEERKERSFPSSVAWALVYPFQKDGLILLGTGTVFFWIGGVVGRFGGIWSMGLAIFAAGYLAAYLQSIIQSSARGEDEMPAWPDFTDLYEDILQPCLRIWATCLLCLGPGWAMLNWVSKVSRGNEAPVPGWVGWTLLVAGGLYLPMALMAVAMADSLAALSPRLVIPSILRVPGDYLVGCGILALSVGLSLVLSFFQPTFTQVPLLSSLIEGFLDPFWRLFWLTVEMRVLGLLYFHNSRRLGWF